jgi:uncharacterized protein YcfJ
MNQKERKMKNTIKFISILMLAFAITSPVFAGHRHANERGPFRHFDQAKVSHVEPIIEIVEVAAPYQTCRIEKVYSSGNPRHSNTPEIVGGIFGGLLGSQIGRGNGKTAATIAGVVLGSSIAHDMEKQHAYRSGYGRSVEVCETRYSYRSEERIVGYHVTYHYYGRTYHTRRDSDPGTHISIQSRN